MGKLITKICWFARKFRDCYNPKSYTRIELFVPKPTLEDPYPCILISIRNGHTKLFFRVENLEAYSDFWSLPQEEIEKLKLGLLKASLEADGIEEDMRLVFQKRRLPKGVELARTDTGEVVTGSWADKDNNNETLRP